MPAVGNMLECTPVDNSTVYHEDMLPVDDPRRHGVTVANMSVLQEFYTLTDQLAPVGHDAARQLAELGQNAHAWSVVYLPEHGILVQPCSYKYQGWDVIALRIHKVSAPPAEAEANRLWDASYGQISCYIWGPYRAASSSEAFGFLDVLSEVVARGKALSPIMPDPAAY